MKNNSSKTNYVIVVDYDENNPYLEDNYLLGWSNKYDWYDCDTTGDEIMTPKGNIKKCKYSLLIDIDRWVSVYVGTEIKDCLDYCKGGNEEGYDCTVCKLEKDSDGEWIVVPVHTYTYVGVIKDEDGIVESFITSDEKEREEKLEELLVTFNTTNYNNGECKLYVLEDYPSDEYRIKKLEQNLSSILEEEGVCLEVFDGINGKDETEIRYYVKQVVEQTYMSFDDNGIDNYR